MDWPFAGSLVLLGASVGTSWNSVLSPKASAIPCICQCDCTSEGVPAVSCAISHWIILFQLSVIVVLAVLCWLKTSVTAVRESKGKGKGVLGGQAAITLT